MRSSLDKEACSQLMIFPEFGTVVYVTFSVLPQQSEHLATIKSVPFNLKSSLLQLVQLQDWQKTSWNRCTWKVAILINSVHVHKFDLHEWPICGTDGFDLLLKSIRVENKYYKYYKNQLTAYFRQHYYAHRAI